MKANVTHKLSGSLFLRRVKAITAIRKFTLDGLEIEPCPPAGVRFGKIAHHIKICVHFSERLQIGFLPVA